ncbi:MAG: transglutaminase domain-containing protein, partial [Thermoflexaceae bacterium]|nr:transglutaminase domain-containing protein [Thermoflexaceae bacterium]
MKKWFVFYGILFSLLFFSMTETYAEEPEKTEESEIVWLAIDDKENFSESQRREAVSPSDEQLIVEGIKNLQTYIPVTDGNLDLDDTGWIYHRHPEIWAYVHGIGLKEVNGVTVCVIVNYHEDALERKTQIEAAMQEALDAIDTEGMSQVDIVLAYYQYLCKLADYDNDYDNDPHCYDGTNYYEDNNGSAYGALVNHKCVCHGYANTFYLLMWMQGIPCEIVYGNNHVWNAVYLNGQWYHLDATWDDVDSFSRMRYSYFLVSEDKLAKDSTHKKFTVTQYGDIPYTKATDDSFEKMFLGKINGFLHFYNGDWYHLGNGDMFYYTISRINLNSMQSTQIFSEKCIWHNGTNSSTYSSQYGYGTGYKNMFYYSKPTTIEAYNLDTGEHGTVFAPELSNEYIFAFGEHDGRPAYQTGVDSWNVGEIKYIDSFVISEAVNGLCKDENGIWHYYRNGMIDTTYVGMAMNEEGWWYVRNGKIDFTYTGMAQNEYGWWYFRNGQLDFSYTGMAYNEYGWWYFRNGTIDWTFTGMACNEYGWWYYRNGTIDWTYTGMACNEYGW